MEKQIHIYIQEVVGGDKIVYTTNQGGSRHREISDIRSELQQLQIPSDQTVLRVCFGYSNVYITIAKPSSMSRGGDYDAVWVVIPSESVYSALEEGHFFEIILGLESRLKSSSRLSWDELKAIDVEIDSPKGQIRASAERAALAYRLYDGDYAELLRKLVQSEYSEYKAVYFLPRHLKPVGAVAKELTNPLKSTCILRYPSDLAEGVSLKVNGQVLKADKRFCSGESLKLRWENAPYNAIETEVTLREEHPEKKLIPPSKAEWLYPFDSDVKARFAGQPVHGARMTINGEEPKAKYSQEEWEQGLKLSFQHPDYQGPGKVLRLNETIFSYEFTERRLSSSYLEELGYKRGQELTIDGEPLCGELWKDKEWWQSPHSFTLVKKKTSQLKLEDEKGLKNLFKTKGDTHHLPQNYPSPNNTQGSNSRTQEQLSSDQEQNCFEPRTWRIIAIACAISLLLNIGLLGYLLYGYFTSSGEKPKTELSTDGAGVADSQQTLDTESLDKVSLISVIKQRRKEFRDQVYQFGNKDLVSVNKKHHEDLKKLGVNLDSLSPKFEEMSLDDLEVEKKNLLDSIEKVKEYADKKLQAENAVLANTIDSLKKQTPALPPTSQRVEDNRQRDKRRENNHPNKQNAGNTPQSGANTGR